MISELITVLGRANLAMAFAALAVMVLRPSAARLFGARVRYVLWAIVPVAGAATLLPVSAAGPPALQVARATVADMSAPFVNTVVEPMSTGLLWPQVLTALWLAGAAAGLALVIRSQRLFLRRGANQGPAVVGFLRPRIRLPADFETRFSQRERQLILTHEELHLANFDARVNGLIVLAQCLFWFNPMVHVAAHLARQDQEMACDEAVVARFPGARKTYAEAMLKTQIAPSPLPLGCYWPAASRIPLERRLLMLKTKTPGLTRRILGAALALSLTAGAGYAAWAAQGPAAQQILDTDMVMGSRFAPVTLIEYGSAGCPHCAQQFLTTLPKLKRDLIDKGELRYVYREQLTGHPALARAGFLTARCGGKDRYFAILGDVFAKQMDIVKSPDMTVPLKAIAQAHGVTPSRLDACLADPEALAALETRVAANRELGKVEGTPSFTVVGKKLTITPGLGESSYEHLSRAIAQARAGSLSARNTTQTPSKPSA